MRLPRWSRSKRDAETTYDVLPSDLASTDTWEQLIVVPVIAALASLWVLLTRIALFVAAVLVGGALLCARIVSLATWTIEAQGSSELLVWRVRGLLRAGRAERDVVAALRSGVVPVVCGRRGDVAESTQV